MGIVAEFVVPATALPLPETSGGSTVTIERTVPMGRSTHYVWILGDGQEEVVERFREAPSADAVEVVDDLPDRTLVRVEWASAEMPLFRVLEEVDATMLGATGRDEEWTAQFRFPDDGALSAFYEACRQRGLSVRIRETTEVSTHDGRSDYSLTPSQEEALLTAFREGYFEVPRETTIADLAGTLGVSDQAVSERLRRGLATVVGTLATQDATGEDE